MFVSQNARRFGGAENDAAAVNCFLIDSPMDLNIVRKRKRKSERSSLLLASLRNLGVFAEDLV